MHLISTTGCWRTRSTMPVKSRNGPSAAFSLVILPSRTISQSAGTSRSTVLHLTRSVFSSAFAMPNSSTPIGSVVAAASKVAVELPCRLRCRVRRLPSLVQCLCLGLQRFGRQNGSCPGALVGGSTCFVPSFGVFDDGYG